MTLGLAEGIRGTSRRVRSTTLRLLAGTEGGVEKRKGRTIIQVRRIDRDYPPLLAHSMGNDSRTVSLPASYFQHFRATGDIPVLQELQAVKSLGVLDAEVGRIVEG